MAFLLVLEELGPIERAVYILRELFDYPYDDVARIVGKSEAHCRQLLHRARPRRSRWRERRRRRPPTSRNA